jgi:DNA-binding NarL/FixJ family response regulator
MSHQLDEMDLQILRLLSEDKSKKEIAPLIYRSYDTVKKRIQKLKEKARCSSNAALVMYFSNEIKELQKAS